MKKEVKKKLGETEPDPCSFTVQDVKVAEAKAKDAGALLGSMLATAKNHLPPEKK